MHAELRFHPWQGLAWLARTRVNILHFLGPSSQKNNGKIKATGLSQQPKKPACPERSSTPSPARARHQAQHLPATSGVWVTEGSRMMTGWSRGDKELPASCCSKPAGMNMGECVPVRTGPFSTGTRCARLERGRRSASPCREEEDWVSNPPGRSTGRGQHIPTVPTGSAWHYPRDPRPKGKGFPCPAGTLCPVLGAT